MKQFILVLFVFILVIGCHRDPLPRNAIKRDKFVDVLVDVHIAEGISTDRFRLKIDSIESTSLYLSVLEKHKVTEEQMLATTLYYSRHQREYKKIFTDVLDKLSILIEEENAKVELLLDIDSIQTHHIEMK